MGPFHCQQKGITLSNKGCQQIQKGNQVNYLEIETTNTLHEKYLIKSVKTTFLYFVLALKSFSRALKSSSEKTLNGAALGITMH